MSTDRTLLWVMIATLVLGQTLRSAPTNQAHTNSPLEVKIDTFELKDATIREGISELSLKNVEGLHLGFEELIRDKIEDDPRTLGTHFSVHMEGRTVEQIVNALCASDPHYTWSEDGASLNVYPRSTTGDAFYLLALRIKHIEVNNIPDPDQGLTPLSKLFPEQQIGYLGSGGEDAYPQPWTAVFERLTVRQFINRIAEHMGPRTSWVWQGGKDERMFTFVKGGFSTFRHAR